MQNRITNVEDSTNATLAQNCLLPAVLRLSLETKWFEMTNPNGKTEDYRDITPYWCSRFLLKNGKKQKQEWWKKYLHWYNKIDLQKVIIGEDKVHRITFIKFSKNVMTLGYPKSSDHSKIKVFENNGIEIRTGKEEWGAVPNSIYFVVMHGAVIA